MVVKRNRTISKPKIIDQYLTAIAKSDLDTALKSFEADGYIRESGGNSHTHAGEKARRKFFEALLAHGGIVFNYCSETFDGDRCAIEYVCDHWGRHKLEPQCGLTVYEIGPFGKIAAMRIYNDIVAPNEK